ncbi:MAG: DUF177 domain-containing protein [Chloroflexota bacterium]
MTRPAPLNLPLAGLLAESSGEARRFDLTGIQITLDDGLVLAGPIEGSLDIARTNRGLIVDGHLRTALTGECSRCLGPALSTLAMDFREEVLPSIDLQSGAAADRSLDPDVTRLNDHHELELETFLREAVSLAAPIAPLCQPDCPGLCIVCGERLGDGHEDHDGADIDPRLAALMAFRVDGDADSE